MSQQIDLRALERKSFAAGFQDGTLEISLGIILLGTGLAEPLSAGIPAEWGWLVVYGLVAGAGLGITWALRRFVTSPRLGTVRLGPAGKRRRGKAMLVMVASLVFSVLLVVLTSAWPALSGGGGLFGSSAQVGALVAAWMLTVFSLGSYVLNYGRGFVIGALYALGLGIGEWMRSPWPILAAATLVALMGLVVFARFVRETPLPQEGADASV